MKKYVIASVGCLIFMFTNCAEPLPDMLDDQPSTGGLATDPASAGLAGDFGTVGESVNPPLMTTPPAAVTPPVTEDNSTTTLYRFFHTYNAQHFMTGNPQEASSPWVLDGTTYKVFNVGYNHRHPVYRCYVESSGDHFSSNDDKCEGYTFEGRYGYLENAPTTAAPRALYRCFHEQQYHHMDSPNKDECIGAGFRVEGIMGYIP